MDRIGINFLQLHKNLAQCALIHFYYRIENNIYMSIVI